MYWYSEAIIYHIFAFSQCGAPFQNDYSETTPRLSELELWIPHIQSMGCNAVLFSPVFKSRTHGYDTTDYFTIDNRIGDNESFRVLVEKFHASGIRVILDGVFNHSGRDFFAFRNLQNGDRSYADWFSGVNFDHGNHLGDSFSYDTWSGHLELVKFNLKNESAKNYLLDAAKFWIEYFNIDGLRLDSANVTDFDFMCQLHRITTNLKPDFWLMGEVVSGEYSRWVNPETLHSVTNYILYKGLFSSHNDFNLFELAYTLQHQSEFGNKLCTFLDNHDQPRIASNAARPEFLNTLYLLLYTLPGVPTIYYGSEWAITGTKQDNSDAPLRPRLDPINPSGDMELAEYIKKLAKIRCTQNALKFGDYRQIYLEYQKPFIFERRNDNNRITVAINISDKEETITLDGNFYDLLNEKNLCGSEITLAPHSGIIALAI